MLRHCYVIQFGPIGGREMIRMTFGVGTFLITAAKKLVYSKLIFHGLILSFKTHILMSYFEISISPIEKTVKLLSSNIHAYPFYFLSFQCSFGISGEVETIIISQRFYNRSVFCLVE